MLYLPQTDWKAEWAAARETARAAALAKKQAAREQRIQAREARHYAKTLARKLERLDICYRYPRSQKDFMASGVERVRFERAVTTDESIWLKINSGDLPRGVNLAMINRDEILHDLSDVLARPVRFESQGGYGSWLVVERDAAYAGIKARLDYTEIMAQYPARSRRPLVVPLGVGRNRTLYFESIDEFQHALIGGATKAGKTTFMHGWICALLAHNKPTALKLVLIDLKGGVEFTRYQGVPHLLNGGFVKTPEAVGPVLRHLKSLIDTRLAQFEEEGGIQNLAEWNNTGHPYLYRVVLFIDELAAIMMEPKLKKECEPLLADICNRGRAPGIHMVVCTQRPDGSVISGRIKVNMDGRFGFRVADGNGSMAIMDDWSASQMPGDTPRGRYIFKWGNTRREIQAALITAAQISDILTELQNPQGLHSALTQSPDELFRFAARAGEFNINKLYQVFRERYGENYIMRIAKNYEGKVIDVDGQLYKMGRLNAKLNRPRSFILLPEAQPQACTALAHCLPPLPWEQHVFYPGVGRAEQCAVRSALDGALDGAVDSELAQLVMRRVLHELNGDYSWRGVYALFAGAYPRRTLEEIGRAYEGQAVTLDGEQYTLQPARGTRPRRLVKLNSQEEK